MNTLGVLLALLINLVVSEDTVKPAAPTDAPFATSLPPTPTPVGPCFILQLSDTQGDGWNGAHYYFRNAAGHLVAQGTLDIGDGSLPPKTRRLEQAEPPSSDDDKQSQGEGPGEQHVQRQICVPDSGCYSYNVTSGKSPNQIQWEIGDAFSGGAPCGPIYFYVFASGAVDQMCDQWTPTSQPSHMPTEVPLSLTEAPIVSTTAPTVKQSLGLTMGPSLMPSLSPEGPCFFLVLIDTYGDGWNGAEYQIFSMSEDIVAQGTLKNGDGTLEPYGSQDPEQVEPIFENATDEDTDEYYEEQIGLQQDQRRICLPRPGCYMYSVTSGDFPDEIKWEMGDSALSGGAPYPARNFYVFANGGLESFCDVSTITPSIQPYACPSVSPEAPTKLDAALTIEPTSAPTNWPTPAPTPGRALGPTLGLTLEPTEATSQEPTPGPAQDHIPDLTLEPSQRPTRTHNRPCFILLLTDTGNDGWNGAEYEFFDESEELVLQGTLEDGDGEAVHNGGSEEDEAEPVFDDENGVDGSYDNNEGPSDVSHGLQQDQRRVCLPAPGCYTFRVTPGQRADEIQWEISDAVLIGGAPFGPKEIYVFASGVVERFCNTSIPTLPPSTQSMVSPTQPQSLTPTTTPTEQPTPQPSVIPTLVLLSTPATTSPSLTPTKAILTLPSARPTSTPTLESSVCRTSMPAPQPSAQTTLMPSVFPHVPPTNLPQSTATSVPLVFPSSQPMIASSLNPISSSSILPTPVPSPTQSSMPAVSPTNRQTKILTSTPTQVPSIRPTPTKTPLPLPSDVPTVMPTAFPTGESSVMSGIPTSVSSLENTLDLTLGPSLCPTHAPTFLPSNLRIPSSIPDTRPSSMLAAPTTLPTSPSSEPSMLTAPMTLPTSPSSEPPSVYPTMTPTMIPTDLPTAPTSPHTYNPTSFAPSVPAPQPISLEPQTDYPSITPTMIPTDLPIAPTSPSTYSPTSVAPSVPASSIAPTTYAPSAYPSFGVTESKPFPCPSTSFLEPTESPIMSPVAFPTIAPSIGPSSPAPSLRPSYSPSLTPPTSAPSSWPTAAGAGGVIIVETLSPTTMSPSSVEPSTSQSLRPSPAVYVPSSLSPSSPHPKLPPTSPPTLPLSSPSSSPLSISPSSLVSSMPSLPQTFPPMLQLSSLPSSQLSLPPERSLSSRPSSQPSLPPALPVSSPPSLPASAPPTFLESLTPTLSPSTFLPLPLPSNMPMSLPYSVPSTSLASPTPSGILPTLLSIMPTLQSPTSSSLGLSSATPSMPPLSAIQTLAPSIGSQNARSAQPSMLPHKLPSYTSSTEPTVLDGLSSARPSRSPEASSLPSAVSPSSQPTEHASAASNVGVASTIVLNGLTEGKFGDAEVGYFNDGLSNTLSFGNPEIRDTEARNLTTVSRRLMHRELTDGPRRHVQVPSFVAVSFVLVYPGINATISDLVSQVQADLEKAVTSNNGSSSPLEVNIKLAAAGADSPLATASVDEDFSLASIIEDTKVVPVATFFPTTLSGSPSIVYSNSPWPIPSVLPTIHSKDTPTMRIIRETIAPAQPASLSPSSTVAPSLLSCKNFLHWNVIPAPPELLDAQFTPSGAQVYITFDSATNRGGRSAGSLFSCAELFEFDDADVSDCFWINTTTVDVDVSNALSFEPGSNVTVKASLLKAACIHSVAECDCYGFSNSSIAIAVKAPADPIVPTAVLQGPYSTSICENVTWSVDQSTGSGGRPMTYVWSIAVSPTNSSGNVIYFSDDNRSSAEAFMRTTLANAQGEPFLTLTETALSRLITLGTQLEVTVVLKNFFAETSESSYIISLEYDEIPSLVIVGGTHLSLSRRSESLTVEAEGYATACDGRPDSQRAVSFHWLLFAIDGSSLREISYISTAKNDRFFELAPYTLDSNSTYLLRTSVVDQIIPANKNTVDIQIQIGIGVVVAAIDGGTTRSASTSEPITLSALNSFDQDDPAATLVFWWSCSRDPLQVNGTVCNDLIFDRSSGVLEIAPNELQAGIYIFTVDAMAQDGRIDTAQTTVTLIDAPILPKIDLLLIQEAVSAAEKLTIAARISATTNNVTTALSTTPLASVWSLTGGDLAEGASLSTVARTPLSVSTDMLSNASRIHYLVIQPYSLVSGGVYSFQLEATTSGTRSVASLDVKVYSPPTAGSLDISPTTGKAFYTLFQLRAPGWVSSSLPLQYRFQTDSGTILHMSSPNTVLEGARLPPGLNPPHLTVTVVVTDGIGARSEASMVVIVEPLQQLNDAIEYDVTDAISIGFARYSLDDICQIIAATAENSNTSLTDTLIAALASAINAYVDPVLEHLEQTIGAALALTKSALQNTAAQDTLNILNGLTETLGQVKDEASAEDNTVQFVAESLSNLLGSELFISTNTIVPGTRRLNIGRNVSGTSQVFVDTLDALTRAQRLTIVDNENPVGFKTKNLASASQKVSNDLGFEAKTIATADMNASVSLLPDNGVSYSSTLTEFSINPRRLDGLHGDEVLSPVVRFKLNKSDTSNALGDEVNLTIPGSPKLSNNATNVSVECECGFTGYKNAFCADTILRIWCDGTPGIIFPCNSSRIACATWDEASSTWVVPPHCETIELAGSTRCNCQIDSNADSADYSTREEIGNTVQLYSELFQRKPNFRRSRLVFFVCLTLLAVIISAALIGEYMDRRSDLIGMQSSRGLRPVQHHFLPSLPSHAVSISEIDTPTMHVLARRKVTLISEEAKTIAQIFIRAHPILNWWHIYSPTSSRKIRALKLGVEMVTLFLALTVEIAFVEFPPADCDKYDEEYTCEHRDLSVGSRKPLCSWDLCSNRCVKRDISDAAQNISHFIMLLITLAIGIPIFAVMDWLIDDYINAPLPRAVRFCFTVCNEGDNVRSGAPHVPDCVTPDTESELPHSVDPTDLACASALDNDGPVLIGSKSETQVDGVLGHHSKRVGDVDEDIESHCDIHVKFEEDPVSHPPEPQGREYDGVAETKKQEGDSDERPKDLSGAAVDERIEAPMQIKEPVTQEPVQRMARSIHFDEVSNATQLSNVDFAVAIAQGVSGSKAYEEDEMHGDSTENAFSRRTKDWTVFVSRCLLALEGARRDLASNESEDSENMKRSSQGSVSFDVIKHRVRHAVVKQRNILGNMASEHLPFRSPFADQPRGEVRRQASRDVENVVREVLTNMRLCLEELRAYRQYAADNSLIEGVALLDEIESFYKREWGWVANSTLWRLKVEAMLRTWMRDAFKLQRELEKLRRSTTKETMLLRMERVLEAEKAARLSRVERNIYESTVQRLDDLQRRRRTTPPTLLAFITTWVVILGIIGAIVVFMLQVATKLGADRSRHWLVAMLVTVVLYYAVIVPIEIVFFDIVLPNLVVDRMRRISNLAEPRAFPFSVTFPTSPVYFLCLLEPSYATTRLGRQILGRALLSFPAFYASSGAIEENGKPGPWQDSSGRDSKIGIGRSAIGHEFFTESLNQIHANVTWKPPPRVRAGLRIASVLLSLPPALHKPIFEEVVLAVSLFGAVAMSWLVSAIYDTQQETISEAIFLVFIVFSLLAIAIIGHSIIRVHGATVSRISEKRARGCGAK